MVILGLATTILFISIFGNGGNFLGTFTLGIGTDVGGLGTLGKDGAPGNVGTLGKDGAPDNVGTLGKDGVDIVIIIYTNASSINPSNACVNSASLIVSIFACYHFCQGIANDWIIRFFWRQKAVLKSCFRGNFLFHQWNRTFLKM